MDDNQFSSDEQDDKKHAANTSPQLQGEASASGSMPEEPMDIDQEEEALGRSSDTNGPRELDAD